MDDYENYDEEPTYDMAYACRICGKTISAAEGDDNDGCCEECGYYRND